MNVWHCCLNRVHWNSLTDGIGVALRFVGDFCLGTSQVFEYPVPFGQHSKFHKKVAPPAGDVEAVDVQNSSLLRTFGLNTTSTYDSYLPLIFGKFVLISGHFQNILASRFWSTDFKNVFLKKSTEPLPRSLRSRGHFRGRWGQILDFI